MLDPSGRRAPLQLRPADVVVAPKMTPERVVDATLDALRHGRPEVLADDTSRFVKAASSNDLGALYAEAAPS